MNNVIGWLFNNLGNVFFRLNGNLDGLDRKNLRNKIMFYCWNISYYHYDKSLEVK